MAVLKMAGYETLPELIARLDRLHALPPDEAMSLFEESAYIHWERISKAHAAMRKYVEREERRHCSEEGTLGPRAIEARGLLARLDQEEL